MAERSKVQTVGALFAAFNAGKVEDALTEANFDPHVEILDFPDIPGRRRYSGRSGVREFLSDVAENWAESHIEIEEIREVGGNVLVLGTQTAVGALRGTPVSSDFGEVVEFDGDRIIKVQMFRDREQAMTAADNA
jgi:ketosteroid isomerase-like protein